MKGTEKKSRHERNREEELESMRQESMGEEEKVNEWTERRSQRNIENETRTRECVIRHSRRPEKRLQQRSQTVGENIGRHPLADQLAVPVCRMKEGTPDSHSCRENPTPNTTT